MSQRRSPGEIRDAIATHLSATERDSSLQEIHAAVQAQLGESVPASSVRSYLSLNCPRHFVRTTRGRYGLPDDDQGPPAEHSPKAELAFTHGLAEMYHGNCLDWLRRRESNSIEGVVTDPPYGLVEYSASEQKKLRNGKGGVWRIPPSFDGHKRSPLPRFTTLRHAELEALDAFFFKWAKMMAPVLVPGAHLIIASNPLLSYLVAGAVSRAGFERRGEIIRLVMTMRGGDRPKNAHEEFPDVTVMPRSMWEPWLLFRKPLEGRVQDNLRRWKTGGLRRLSKSKPFGDVIQSHPTRSSERGLAPHPSLKPQSFLRQVVRAVLPVGEGTVLDPFAGSGSTLAAAEVLGYRSIGIESDPAYTALAKEAIPRLSLLNGGTASGQINPMFPQFRDSVPM